MKKIDIIILESKMRKGCFHDNLSCNDCGSLIMMREPKVFNSKRFEMLAKKVRESTEEETNAQV